MLKLADNPPVLGTGKLPLREVAGRWWVAHSKARCEKTFAWDLHARKIPYFLPMVERITFSGGRKRRGMAPLFPSYIFFCGSPEARESALATAHLCQVIEVRDQARLVNELAAIELVLRSAADVSPYPQMPIGSACRIVRGALQGIEGVVVGSGKLARLVLQVSILGQCVSLEIEAGLLEPVAKHQEELAGTARG